MLLALMLAVSICFGQGTPPSPPTLLFPPAGASEVPTYLTFSWTPSEGATSYDLQVSLSPLFEAFVVNETEITGNAFTPWQLFAEGTTYYWRVRAVDASGASRWEPAVTGQPFATKQDSLAPPTLLTPADNAQGIPPLVTFSWEPAAGATAYDFQLAATPLFLSPLADVRGYPGTVLVVPSPLPSGTVYFWRVRSTGPAGTSVWSPLLGGRSFSIEPGLLPSPTLLSPAKDAQGVSTLPTFAWSAVPGAEMYQLLVTDAPLIGNVLANVKGIPGTEFTLLNRLDNSTTYYWRVQAWNLTEGTTSMPAISGQAFTTESNGLPAPTLVAPLDGAKDLPRAPLFTWNPVPGAETYEILITSSQFLGGSEYRQTGLTETSFTPPPGALNPGVAYSWFVRAHNATGNSPWGPGQAGWAFTTRLAPPSAPPLQTPANGDTGLARTLVLGWWNNTDSTATSFCVQVATDSAFQQMVVERAQVPSTEVVVTLASDTKYYWRVLAANSEGVSPWSEIWHFSTGGLLLLPPVLVSPQENAQGVPVRPTFTWEPAPGAVSYDLQVYAPTGLPVWYLEKTIDEQGLPGTTYKPGFPLRKGTTYAWRVRSIGSADTSLWSPLLTTRLFSTVPPAPPATSLVSPSHETTQQTLTPSLCWAPLPEVKFYWVEISLDDGFSHIVGSYCEVGPPCFAVPEALSPNTTYYWRVSAKNDGGWGPHSPIWSFSTANLAPEAPSIVRNPVDEQIQIGQTATFSVLARGTGPLAYQWQKGGVDIPGATGPSYSTGPVKSSEDGMLYRCAVTNALGVAISKPAVLMLSQTSVNLISNGEFESGMSPWFCFSDGVAEFSSDRPGPESQHAGSVRLVAEGVNQQLYQIGLRVEPATYYRLRFRARADNGGFVSASLLKHACPYTNYGLEGEVFALTSAWKWYAVEFPTSGFFTIVHDARLTFALGAPHAPGDRYEVDDVSLEKIFTKDRYDTVVVNSGFEQGLAPWVFVTSGEGSMSDDAQGDGSPSAGLVRIVSPGKNTQFYQANLMFVPDAVYQLTFKAYSTSGHDVAVSFHRHDYPHTSYGLNERVFDLTTSWRAFSIRFVTPRITELTNNGRLRFWFPPYAGPGDEYFFDDIVLERLAPSAVADGGSLIANPGFERGTESWTFYTDGEGYLSSDAPGDSSDHAASVMMLTPGTSVQLYQANIPLKPGMRYQLSFKAYSTSGNNVGVYLQKHGPPYTPYGLEVWDVDLTADWKRYTYTFTTSGFETPVADARLRFALDGFAQAGDRYYFDDVMLEAASSSTAQAHQGDAGDGYTGGIPSDFTVGKNYPNPFNPTTSIWFGVPELAEVTLKVYNVVGQEVATLFEGNATAGYHQARWAAQSANGQLSSGVYFYRFIARGASGRTHTEINKMILLR
jgi:hypothetical protein